MSIHVSTWVQNHSNAKLGERLVLLILADNADEETLKCWPSVQNIAHRTRLSDRQVQRCLRSLETAGRITVELGSGRGNLNLYRILKTCQYDDTIAIPKGCHIVTLPSTERVTSTTVKGDISCEKSGPILNEPSGNRHIVGEGISKTPETTLTDMGSFQNFFEGRKRHHGLRKAEVGERVLFHLGKRDREAGGGVEAFRVALDQELGAYAAMARPLVTLSQHLREFSVDWANEHPAGALDRSSKFTQRLRRNAGREIDPSIAAIFEYQKP